MQIFIFMLFCFLQNSKADFKQELLVTQEVSLKNLYSSWSLQVHSSLFYTSIFPCLRYALYIPETELSPRLCFQEDRETPQPWG